MRLERSLALGSILLVLIVSGLVAALSVDGIVIIGEDTNFTSPASEVVIPVMVSPYPGLFFSNVDVVASRSLAVTSPTVLNTPITALFFTGTDTMVSNPLSPPFITIYLRNTSNYPFRITWVWNDPPLLDFSHVMVYVNSIHVTNITGGIQSYTAVNLTMDTPYTVGLRIVNNTGAIYPNWYNLTVRTARLYPFPGYSTLPLDTDGDILHEDTNGNGRIDFQDIVLYFDAMDWVTATEPWGCFDFNSNGRIDFDDIVRLFEEV